ncbi:MAG: hypothetical protein AB7J35_16915 [Dehalococcoidia bacterium]
MTELPDDSVLLLRRAAPDALDRSDSSVRHNAFRLRPSRGELSLSFYDASLVSAEQVLAGAPTSGWGVAAITAGVLRSLGFRVSPDTHPVGEPLSPAHVSAVPQVLDDGQIPLAAREAVARQARWIIVPGQ